MNNLAIIKRLETINKSLTSLELSKLIDELKQDELTKEYTGLSSKQRINKCLNYSKKISKKLRPILGYTDNDQIKNKQVFCDSYFLVALSNDDKTPIQDYKEINEKWNYPNIKWADTNRSNYNNNKVFSCSVSLLLNYCKVYDNFGLLNKNGGFETYVNSKTLEMFIAFMNLKPADQITLKQISVEKPVLIEKENGTFGILMPIKKLDNIKMLEV